MKHYIVKDTETFVEDVIGEFEDISENDFKAVSVVGYYEDITPIIKELGRYEDVYFVSLEVGLNEVTGYDEEYTLSIDSDYGVFVEPTMRDNKYLDYETDVLYIFGDSSAKIVDHNMNKEATNYLVDYEDEVKEDVHEVDTKETSSSDVDDNYVVVKSNMSDEEVRDLLGRVKDNLIHMDECFEEMDRIRRMFGW